MGLKPVFWFFLTLGLDVTLSMPQPLHCGDSNSMGYTMPQGDIVIEHGKDLEIYCILNKGVNFSRELYFKRNSVRIPSNFTKIINATTIKLLVPHPPLVQKDEYACFSGSYTICFNFVGVGIKPKDVTDFNCINYNFENLTCTWTAANYIKTDYELTYEINNTTTTISPTVIETPIKLANSTETISQLSCTWYSSSGPIFLKTHTNFTFTLTATNKLGSNTQSFNFDHYSHVLPNPPENIEWKIINSSVIELSWVIPHFMEMFQIHGQVHHRILYTYAPYNNTWIQAAMVENKCVTCSYNLTVPYANTLYDIRVSSQSVNATEESMWSKNATVCIRSSEKIPDAPPLTDIGSFEIHSNAEAINLYIFWKQIDERQMNGNNFHYFITSNDSSLASPEVQKTYAKYILPSRSKSYSFQIWSKNSMGLSEKYSTITIPSDSNKINLPLSVTQIDLGNRTFEVVWTVPSDTVNLTHYTIYWCTNKNGRPYRCDGMLDWRTIDVNATSHKEQVTTEENYQFAISANSGNLTSGLAWAECTYFYKDGVPKLKEPTFVQSSKSVNISWMLECSKRSGEVRGAIIYYCSPESRDSKECLIGDTMNRTFREINMREAKLDGLKPNTYYLIKVALLVGNPISHIKPASDYVQFVTLEDAPSPPLDFTAHNVTQSSISYTWTPPKEPNGHVYYSLVINNSVEINAYNNISYKYNGLEGYQWYNATLKACTSVNHCSNSSNVLKIRTLMGAPAMMDRPTSGYSNLTAFKIKWYRPKPSNGLVNYYEVLRSEKVDGKVANKNKTKIFCINATECSHTEYCTDKKYKDYTISVRAVNVLNETISYEGEWSDEYAFSCRTSDSYWVFMCSFIGVLLVVGIAFAALKIYLYAMKVVNTDIVVPPNMGKDKVHQISRSGEDSKLLSNNRHSSHDSGNDSASLHVSSTNLSVNASDSGTEQRTDGIDDREKVKGIEDADDFTKISKSFVPISPSIILRKAAPQTNAAGYVVTMPLNKGEEKEEMDYDLGDGAFIDSEEEAADVATPMASTSAPIAPNSKAYVIAVNKHINPVTTLQKNSAGYLQAITKNKQD